MGIILISSAVFAYAPNEIQCHFRGSVVRPGDTNDTIVLINLKVKTKFQRLFDNGKTGLLDCTLSEIMESFADLNKDPNSKEIVVRLCETLDQLPLTLSQDGDFGGSLIREEAQKPRCVSRAW